MVKIRKVRWVMYATSTRDRKLEKIRPLGRPNIRCESNIKVYFNPLNAELNPICHFLALLGAHHILHVSRIRVQEI